MVIQLVSINPELIVILACVSPISAVCNVKVCTATVAALWPCDCYVCVQLHIYPLPYWHRKTAKDRVNTNKKTKIQGQYVGRKLSSVITQKKKWAYEHSLTMHASMIFWEPIMCQVNNNSHRNGAFIMEQSLLALGQPWRSMYPSWKLGIWELGKPWHQRKQWEKGLVSPVDTGYTVRCLGPVDKGPFTSRRTCSYL